MKRSEELRVGAFSACLGTGSSKMLATAVIVIWEVLDETK